MNIQYVDKFVITQNLQENVPNRASQDQLDFDVKIIFLRNRFC